MRFRNFCIFAFFLISISTFANERFLPDENLISVLNNIELTEKGENKNELSAKSFITFSLIASGATQNEIPSAIAKIDNAYEKINAKLLQEKSLILRAEKTLEYLYEEIFTRYETLQTRVDIALQTGSYNCVSSTIIYMYFIKKQGIQGSAIETPQHAFCTLTIDGKQIDVETTNPHGFNPGVKKPLSQEESKRKGYYIVPAKNYSIRKQIDDVRLLSLIYENRISELQRQKNDKETIGLSLDACTLQNNSEKAKHLVHQCVSNTAVSYMRNGNIEKGISLVTEAKNTFGDSSLYNDFFLAAVTNLTTSYAKKNDYETAMQKLENYKHLIHEQNYRDILNRLTYNNIVLDVQKLPFEDAYSLIQKNKNSLHTKNYTILIGQIYSLEANKIAKEKNYLQAFLFLDNGLKQFPTNENIIKSRNAYRQNFIGETHNKATKLLREGKKKEAIAILEDALKYVENSMLRNDLKRFLE